MIFRMVAKKYALEPSDAIIDFVMDQITNGYGEDLAGYQPKFICEHVVNACKFKGETAAFSEEEVRKGLGHLLVRDTGKLKNMAHAA